MAIEPKSAVAAVSPKFWRGKTVLVTGHTGFKGSWLALWLQRLGANVVGYSLQPPTNPSLYSAADVEAGMVSVTGDVRDASAVADCFARYSPDVVLHLAAQSLVRYGYDHPVETYSTNVIGMVNVLEAIRSTTSVRAAVAITSDKCYDNREWVWGYRESDALGGSDPYSNSKGCAELVVSAYQRSFFGGTSADSRNETLVASARAGNVIGGGDWAKDRLLPDLVRAISEGRAPVIRNPQAVRPWQHVLEPLSGYLLLAFALLQGGKEYVGGWNFGPMDEGAVPVKTIVELACAQWLPDRSWTLDRRATPHETNYLKLDCSKARRHLHWRPILPLRDALSWTISWYKDYYAGRPMREACCKQIEAFSDKLRASHGVEDQL